MSITLDQFIKKWNGKSPVHPKGIPGQCVALYRLYLDEVLRLPQSPPVSGARLIWNTTDPDYFERIPKSPLAIPKKGDIIIFSAFPGNPYGHVGMCVTAGLFSFTSFDSNWSIPKKARMESHNYRYVIGWLRPRNMSIDVPGAFKRVWGRDGAPGDISYFVRRLKAGTIKGADDLDVKLKYWYGIVYPNGTYSAAGDNRWQDEKKKL